MAQDQVNRTIKGAAIGPPGVSSGIGPNGASERNYPYGIPSEIAPELAAVMIAKIEQERDQKWVSWAQTKFTECKSARVQYERQWFINLAFTAGRQYVAPAMVPGYGFRLSTPRAAPHRVRLVINKIRKAVRTECSKLTTSKPIPTVVPATNEREDYSAAVLGEQILRARFNTADFEHTYRMAIWWATVCGTGFIKQYWDPNALDYDVQRLPEPPKNPITGEDLSDAIINQVPGLKKKLETPIPAQGKIIIDKINPFYIYVPDLMADTMEAQPFVIHTMTQTKEWVKNRFGFEPTADAKSAATTLDTSMIIARGSEQYFDAVMVMEIWIKPGSHPDFPQGGMLTIINNRLVQKKTSWPLPFPEYPFYKLDAIPTGGFYSDSIVVDLIPLQKEYNKTRSKGTEIKNLMGVPRLLYQEGSLNPRKITTEAGQAIPYTAGYEKPEVLAAVEIPTSYVTEVQQIAQEFDDIANQHDLTQNGDPSSGTSMAFLQEQDDLLLTYQTSSIEHAVQYLGRHYLTFASHNWDDDRVIKVTGRNQSYEAIHWKKDSLQGNTDVRVQTGSALPVSKAARSALITEMMQNGFISPEAGLEVLDMGDLDRMMSEYLTDKNQAMRENLKMVDLSEEDLKFYLSPHADDETGQEPFEVPNPDPTLPPQMMNGDGTPFEPQPPIATNSYDNDEEHIKWHNQFRKTQEFEILSDEKKQAFELHVQSHQFNLMANQVNMSGQIVQPGMGGGGGGSDPSMGGAGDPNMDPSAPPTGGEAVGASDQDPQFAEDPANRDDATARARAVDARTNTGMFKN